jgi:hypothetical protein
LGVGHCDGKREEEEYFQDISIAMTSLQLPYFNSLLLLPAPQNPRWKELLVGFAHG